ncbi:hypothetical protein B7494_g2 [Chlorociboria aeruginascens]|nr:hypothetical protein B7494_g2 [Chlorociboria aeruginascens]
MATNPQMGGLAINGINHGGISPWNTESTPDTNHNRRNSYVVSPQYTGALDDAYQGIELMQSPPQAFYTKKSNGFPNAKGPQQPRQPQQPPYYDPPKRMEVPQHQGVGIEMEGSQPLPGTKTQQSGISIADLSDISQFQPQFILTSQNRPHLVFEIPTPPYLEELTNINEFQISPNSVIVVFTILCVVIVALADLLKDLWAKMFPKAPTLTCREQQGSGRYQDPLRLTTVI